MKSASLVFVAFLLGAGACTQDTNLDGDGGVGGGGSGGTGGGGSGGAGDCGNDARDGSEPCDGDDVGDATCGDYGYLAGSVTCSDTCELESTGCILPICGDSLVVGVEECDTDEFDGATCESLGEAAGPLVCDELCRFDISLCGTAGPQCGDGVREAPEECDGTDLNLRDCQFYGFDSGTLGCVACRPSFALCVLEPPVCGDGEAEGLEACDGADTRGQTCATLDLGTGTLGCTPGCNALDLTTCTDAPECGDDDAQALERCDSTDLRGQTCTSLEFGAGDLACDPSCLAYDTSACTEPPACGNNAVEGDETCDGSDLVGLNCENTGNGTGTLACAPGCRRLDFSGCSDAPTCGDAEAEGNEVCDGVDLRGAALCAAYGYDAGSGAPTCMPTCLLQDLSGCGAHATCGDPSTGPFGSKQCDGTQLYLQTCISLGFAGGTLACNANCSFDVSACTLP